METFKTETYLPVFTGFYGTIFEPQEDYEIECINEIRRSKNWNEIGYDDCEWDYKEYFISVSKDCTSFLGNQLKLLGLVENIEFQKLSSPREYNFYNDSIHVEIEFSTKNVKKISKIILDNFPRFDDWIKERYTNRDGFISYHSNNSFDWSLDITSSLKDIHKAGAILDFICGIYDIDEIEMYEYIQGNNYLPALNYSELTEQEVIS